jgi:hypothetical protein
MSFNISTTGTIQIIPVTTPYSKRIHPLQGFFYGSGGTVERLPTLGSFGAADTIGYFLDFNNAVPALNDYWMTNIFLPNGLYSVNLVFCGAADRATVTLLINNVIVGSPVGTQPITDNIPGYGTFTASTRITTGVHNIKMRVTGGGTAGGLYFHLWNSLDFLRVGD